MLQSLELLMKTAQHLYGSSKPPLPFASEHEKLLIAWYNSS
jgi:hypothetical protein